MKNSALDGLKETKKKVDLQNGKHLCMLLVWIAVHLAVWFQPESTLRTWVLLASTIAILHRVWAQGRCSGVSELLNVMIEGFDSKESSSDELTRTLQKIGNTGVKASINNKKGAGEGQE